MNTQQKVVIAVVFAMLVAIVIYIIPDKAPPKAVVTSKYIEGRSHYLLLRHGDSRYLSKVSKNQYEHIMVGDSILVETE